MNLAFVGVVAVLVWLFIGHRRNHGPMHHDMAGDGPLKRGAAVVAGAILTVGLLALALTGGTA